MLVVEVARKDRTAAEAVYWTGFKTVESLTHQNMEPWGPGLKNKIIPL